MNNVVSRKAEPVSGLHITIEYEDQTSTDIIVSKEDLVEVNYIVSGILKTTKGRISGIRTETVRCINGPSTSFIIVDASSQYKSEQVTIDVNDIITITKVVEEVPVA